MYDKDIHSSYLAPDVNPGDILMRDYKGYPLWVHEYTKLDDVPTNCRIDDLTISKLIDEGKPAKFYNSNWPIEFDKKKMIKSARMPLGFAAKMHVNKGDKDRHGNLATEPGWYYKWFRGIHILCGEEGVDNYKHRPSHEDAMPNTWYFDLNFKCIFQDAERGDNETGDVIQRIGSELVAAVIAIRKSNSGTRKGKGKESLKPEEKKGVKPEGKKGVSQQKGSVKPQKGVRLTLKPPNRDN